MDLKLIKTLEHQFYCQNCRELVRKRALFNGQTVYDCDCAYATPDAVDKGEDLPETWKYVTVDIKEEKSGNGTP